MMYQYFVKVVPTVYMKTDGEVSATFLEYYPNSFSRKADEHFFGLVGRL